MWVETDASCFQRIPTRPSPGRTDPLPEDLLERLRQFGTGSSSQATWQNLHECCSEVVHRFGWEVGLARDLCNFGPAACAAALGSEVRHFFLPRWEQPLEPEHSGPRRNLRSSMTRRRRNWPGFGKALGVELRVGRGFARTLALGAWLVGADASPQDTVRAGHVLLSML